MARPLAVDSVTESNTFTSVLLNFISYATYSNRHNQCDIFSYKDPLRISSQPKAALPIPPHPKHHFQWKIFKPIQWFYPTRHVHLDIDIDADE
jgi:hypothetical protein